MLETKSSHDRSTGSEMKDLFFCKFTLFFNDCVLFIME